MAGKKPAGAAKPPESKRQSESADAEQNRATRARGNGKGSRTPDQLKRQEEVFTKRVLQRMTVRQVAEAMKISQETVIADTRAEMERRANENAAERELLKAEQLALVEQLFVDAMGMRAVPGTGALGAAAKALEMRAKIQGLDAPTRVEIGVESLLEALSDGLPDA